MPYYHYPTIIGNLYFDVNLELCPKPKQVKAQILDPTSEKKQKIRTTLKDTRFFAQFVKANIEETVKGMGLALHDDVFVIQTAEAIDDATRMLNMAHNRLREWAGYAFPEFVHQHPDTGILVDLLLKEGLRHQTEMGTTQSAESEKALNSLVVAAQEIRLMLESLRTQLDHLARTTIPNITTLCGTILAAKLLAKAGSLERMARMPASTIQLLGAEAALFRHLKTNAKPPKHGVIHEHPLITRTPKAERGKTARHLANKISIAAKVDFFKGEFIGDTLKKEIARRFGPW